MDIKYLNLLLTNESIVTEKIKAYMLEKTIIKMPANKDEIKGHLLKADNNLRFVSDNIKLKHFDWCITGCYYAVYHAALALCILKGYHVKSHDATLCILIKEHYRKGISAEEIDY